MRQFLVRHPAVTVLAAVNFALITVAMLLWFDSSGQIKRTRWTPPAPKTLELPTLPDTMRSPSTAQDVSYLAILERPLFAPDRKAPPVAQAPTAGAPSDLSDIQILGVFGGGEFGGVIALVDGKPKRVLLNEELNGWILSALDGTSATLSKGDERQTIRAGKRKDGGSITSSAVPSGASESSSGNSSVPATTSFAEIAEAERQRQQEEAKATLARRNALRAKAGLPPVKE